MQICLKLLTVLVFSNKIKLSKEAEPEVVRKSVPVAESLANGNQKNIIILIPFLPVLSQSGWHGHSRWKQSLHVQ